MVDSRRSGAPPLTPIAWIYLAMSVIGGVTTWSYDILALREMGSAFTPAAFVRVGFAGSPLLGSLAADFWVGSLAALLWMIIEGRRLRMRGLWAYVLLTFGVAWAFAFPLFLFMRERRLAVVAGAWDRPEASGSNATDSRP